MTSSSYPPSLPARPESPHNFDIRPAELRDVEDMAGLLAELFAIEADFDFDREKQAAGLRLLVDSAKDCVLVAEAAGRVVGMVSGQTVISTAEGAPVGWVEDLVVAESWRGQGVGRALLERVEDWAEARGVTRLQLLADGNNAPALEFYRRQGWAGTALVALRKFPGRTNRSCDGNGSGDHQP
jgi:ribosomal protein S18 acetylase RimI-like enzyme